MSDNSNASVTTANTSVDNSIVSNISSRNLGQHKQSNTEESFETMDNRESSLQVLDTNGDGVLDAQEILNKYDTNGDGLLDSNEMDSMGKQLSQQLDFNNQLLTHLRSLEGEYYNVQNDLKKQTLALKLALSASTAARTQALEFKNRLNVTEQLNEQLRKNQIASESEVEKKKRHIDDLKGTLQESKKQIEGLHDMKTDLEDQLHRSQYDVSAKQEELKRTKTVMDGRIELLEKDVNKLNQELINIKAPYQKLTEEKQALVVRNGKLQDDLEDIKNSFLSESKIREEKEAKIKDLTTQIKALIQRAHEKEFQLKEEQQNVFRIESQLQIVLENEKQAKEDYENTLRLLNELKREYKDTFDENRALKNELEQIANELLAQAKQRAHEQERWSKKLAQAQEQLSTVTRDARIQAEQFALENQKRVAENMDERKKDQEQYVALQKDHAELHGLLTRIHEEHQGHKEAFENERHDFNNNIKELENTIRVLKSEKFDLEKEYEDIIEALKEENRNIKIDMNSRGKRFVDMLQQVQNDVKGLYDEGKASQEAVNEITNDFKTFKKTVGTFTEKQIPQLNSWFVESNDSIDLLKHQNLNLNKELENEKDKFIGKENEIQKKDCEINDLKGQISDLRFNESSLNHVIKELKRDIDLIKKNSQTKVTLLEEEKKQSLEDLHTSKALLDSVNNRYSKMEQDYKDLDNAHGSLKIDFNNFKVVYERKLEDEKEVLEAKEKKNMELLNKLQLLTEENRGLIDENTSNRDEIKGLKELVDELETRHANQLREKNQEINELRKRNNQYLEQNQNLQQVKAFSATGNLSRTTVHGA